MFGSDRFNADFLIQDSADPRSELYDRSVQVEPQTGVDPRKKFDWLRR